MASPSRVATKKPSAKTPPPAGAGRFYLLLGGAAVIGIGILAYLIFRPKEVSIPADVSILASDTAGFRGYVMGSDSAKVEISEYADFQCPACGSFEILQFDVVKRQLIDSGLVRWRYRDFPLPQHKYSRLAAHAAACADDQGKYWPYHRALYDNQGNWSFAGSATGLFRTYAGQVGLDVAKYDACMTSAKYAPRIKASMDEGTKLGVASTPTFLIAGRLYRGVLSSDTVAAIARAAAAQPTQ